MRPSNWNEIAAPAERRNLDVTAAVCGIKKAVVQEDDFGAKLCIVFDIAEGEYSGYYQEEFDNNQFEGKKWKGVLRLWLPKNDGSEQDEWTKRTLKGFVTAIEKSNPGYTWNWDEKSLASKWIGILYRNEEWEYNGKHGWTKRPFRAISIDSVREGSFKAPKDKPLKNKSYDSYGSYSDTTNYAVVEEEDDMLPF
jgi:hypothetical protein